jgi:outer membrane lipoprotein-sorting protein
MNPRLWIVTLFVLALSASMPARAADLSPGEVIEKAMSSDPWGLSGADISAHATLTDKRGSTSDLAFTARSKRYDALLSKSIVRFSAPADVAGAGFLQIQKKDGDDDRFLFLPELKRSRRISGNLTTTAFMGTDFSFADLDRRDFRESTARSLGADENIGRFPCYHIDVTSRRSGSEYSHIEVWIRKDNFLPLKMLMFDKANVLLKTFTVQEVRRVQNQWFITKSQMVNQAQSHTTDLVIDQIVVKSDIPDEEFTVRALEKS